jgi:hypothetical protein
VAFAISLGFVASIGAGRFVLLAASGASDAASGLITRSVSLAVYTKKLLPIADLKVDEVVVSEAGKPRKVLGMERDDRSLEVAIVVDSGGASAASYRSDLVPAVVDFWKALPADTKFALWSTAPAKIMDFDGDPAAAETKLRMIVAAGGNYGLDSMTDACKELGRRGAPRRAIVYVGSGALQASLTGTSALMMAVGEARATPMAILVLPSARGGFSGGPSGDSVFAWDVQGYFGQLAKAYGGAYVEAISALAVAQWLKQFSADLNGQYRVRFESEAGPAGALKVEVKRKDTKTRIGRTSQEIAIQE